MRIDLQKNSSFLHGCACVEKKDKGLQLHRFTPSLMEFYRFPEHREIRAVCPSGVRLMLRTDSRRISFPVSFGRIARPIFAFDVLVDGADAPWRYENEILIVELDGKPHLVEIALPHLVECFAGEPETDDGAFLEPVAGKEHAMLFIGDSIMQGMTVSRPSLAYADRLARFLDCEYSNLSVGGAVMKKELGTYALEYQWDRIVVGFGVNDFNTGRPPDVFSADAEGALAALTSRRNADIVLLGPIHWAGRSEPNALGLHLSDYCEALRSVAGKFPAVRFIDGRSLLPDDTRYYVDCIHPNDAGEEILFRNLTRHFLPSGTED